MGWLSGIFGSGAQTPPPEHHTRSAKQYPQDLLDTAITRYSLRQYPSIRVHKRDDGTFTISGARDEFRAMAAILQEAKRSWPKQRKKTR